MLVSLKSQIGSNYINLGLSAFCKPTWWNILKNKTNISTCNKRLVSLSVNPWGKRITAHSHRTTCEDIVGFMLTQKWAQHTKVYWSFWVWNCCLQNPIFNPMLKPHQGGDVCYFGLGSLSPKAIFQQQHLPCSTGMGHPLSMAPCAHVLVRWVYPVCWFYQSLASTFPAKKGPTIFCLTLLFIVHLTKHLCLISYQINTHCSKDYFKDFKFICSIEIAICVYLNMFFYLSIIMLTFFCSINYNYRKIPKK